MSGYTPLFSSLTTGTLCGRWPDIGLWPIVLSLSDRNGIVDVTPAYIAGVTGLPVADVSACMKRFCEPDADSRSSANAGARLELVAEHRDWGWRIVNHGMYRDKARKASFDSARVADGRNAQRMKTRRDPTRPDVSAGDPPSYSDSNIDSEKIKKKNKKALTRPDEVSSPLPDPPPGLDLSAWAEWYAYRKQSPKPIKDYSVAAAQRELASFGANQARVVQHSIANSYQGLFAPKVMAPTKEPTRDAAGNVMMFGGKPVEWA